MQISSITAHGALKLSFCKILFLVVLIELQCKHSLLKMQNFVCMDYAYGNNYLF